MRPYFSVHLYCFPPSLSIFSLFPGLFFLSDLLPSATIFFSMRPSSVPSLLAADYFLSAAVLFFLRLSESSDRTKSPTAPGDCLEGGLALRGSFVGYDSVFFKFV